MAKLKDLGVRDSKKLSSKRRELLYPEINETCERVVTLSIAPTEIDAWVNAGRKYRKLNYLEAVYMARVIDRLGAARAVVDASDASPARFGRYVSDNLNSVCTVVSRHFADRDFPAVSAASIVAKVERDSAVARLRDRHGDFGSGYPSDPKTRSFFAEWIRGGRDLPSFVRKSWKTWDSLKQSLLVDF